MGKGKVIGGDLINGEYLATLSDNCYYVIIDKKHKPEIVINDIQNNKMKTLNKYMEYELKKIMLDSNFTIDSKIYKKGEKV